MGRDFHNRKSLNKNITSRMNKLFRKFFKKIIDSFESLVNAYSSKESFNLNIFYNNNYFIKLISYTVNFIYKRFNKVNLKY